MSLLSATRLGKAFGPVDIFQDISLSVPREARIAIVGPNGIGKTTLLRILVGLDEPSSGTVQRALRLKIGYLPQEAGLNATHTLWEECLNAVADLRAQEAELSRLETEMSDPQRAGETLEHYGRLQEAFERQGGYTYDLRIRQILSGLGFAGFFILISRAAPPSGLWPLVAARLASLSALLVVSVATRRPIRLEPASRLTATLAGLLDMAANILYVLAARSGLLALVAVVVSLYAGPTVLLAHLVLGERLARWRLAGLALAIASVALMSLR